MKITRQEAGWIVKTLQQQAKRNRDLLGAVSTVAPFLEKAAQALKRGEGIEVNR